MRNARSASERADEFLMELVEFSSRCLEMLDTLPRDRAGVANFRDQLSRSSTSIAANYTEATAAESRRDFAAKIAVALKEAKESRTWLFIIEKRGFCPSSTMKPLLNEVNSFIRRLNASVTTARRRISAIESRSKNEQS